MQYANIDMPKTSIFSLFTGICVIGFGIYFVNRKNDTKYLEKSDNEYLTE